MRTPHASHTLRLLACATALSVALGAAARVEAAPGDLDPSFAGDGVAETDLPGNTLTFPSGIVLQPDGKIVAIGMDSGGNGLAAVLRYLADGTLDPSFGSGGVVVTDGVQLGTAGALQPDGKLLVLAAACVLLRFNPDGTLDDSFADHGKLLLRPDGSFLTSAALLVQSDGKILVLGNIEQPYPTPSKFVLVRLDEDGGTDMVVRGTWTGRALALQPDGKILVGGDRLARYHANGTLDDSFGSGGEVAGANAYELALSPDGTITAICSGTCMERFTADGAFDASFGDGGRTAIPLDQLGVDVGFLSLFGLVAQPDGRAIAVGRSTHEGFVVRVDRNGRPDASFGPGGGVRVPSVANAFFGVALQPDGKAVAVGGDRTFNVARFLGDVCGDGIQQDPETCDDGDLDDGDGCDSNCRPTGCGNGIVTAGEACDDGNLAGGDCCGPSCTIEPAGGACNDGDACTLGDTCQDGACAGGSPRDCDDGDGCTADACEPFSGLCRHDPSTALTCTSPLERLAWFRKLWGRGSGVPDAEPHFGAQTVLAGDRLFVLAPGEYYGTNVQILDRETGALLHYFMVDMPDEELSRMGPIAALGDDLVVVSTAPFDGPFDPEVEPVGETTVDVYDGTTFALRQQLADPTPDTAWDRFGTGLYAIAGHVLVYDPPEHAIYVFDPESGELVHTLLAPPPEDPSEFGGRIVALGSSVLVRGAGAVHLFDVASGALLRTFADPTPGLGEFGDAIAPYGPDVLIGGRREDAVYLFDAATGATLRVFADPDHVDRLFGDSVVVVGDRVVVGRGKGRVHVFDGTDGAFLRTILDPSASPSGCFGGLLPVLGDKLAVSDACADYGPYARETDAGVVYVFDPETGELIGAIPDQPAEFRDQLQAVAAWDHTILTHVFADHNGGLRAYTSCIDGAVATGEECDDRNYVSGDGCDANCTATRCGNGLVTDGEACDDGNQVDDDDCSNQCVRNVCGDGVLRPNAEQCDDGAANGTETSCCTTWCGFRTGAACTIPGVCGGAGLCAANTCIATSGPCWPCGACDPELGCVPAPRNDCRASLHPRQSTLTIDRNADSGRGRLAWRWRKGATTWGGDFGEPAIRDAYELCLYDESEGSPRTLLGIGVPPAGLCRNQKFCWQRFFSGAMYRYRDAGGSAGGLTSIDLKPGDDGHAQVTVTARGRLFHPPPLPLSSPVRMQLRASTGACWEQTYSVDGMGRNDPNRFRARGN